MALLRKFWSKFRFWISYRVKHEPVDPLLVCLWSFDISSCTARVRHCQVKENAVGTLISGVHSVKLFSEHCGFLPKQLHLPFWSFVAMPRTRSRSPSQRWVCHRAQNAQIRFALKHFMFQVVKEALRRRMDEQTEENSDEDICMHANACRCECSPTVSR